MVARGTDDGVIGVALEKLGTFPPFSLEVGRFLIELWVVTFFAKYE